LSEKKLSLPDKYDLVKIIGPDPASLQPFTSTLRNIKHGIHSQMARLLFFTRYHFVRQLSFLIELGN